MMLYDYIFETTDLKHLLNCTHRSFYIYIIYININLYSITFITITRKGGDVTKVWDKAIALRTA